MKSDQEFNKILTFLMSNRNPKMNSDNRENLPHCRTMSPAVEDDIVFKHNGNVHTGHSALKR